MDEAQPPKDKLNSAQFEQTVKELKQIIHDIKNYPKDIKNGKSTRTTN